MSPGKMFYTI